MGKSMKKKLLEIVQVTVPNFFYFDEIWKTKQLWVKTVKILDFEKNSNNVKKCMQEVPHFSDYIKIKKKNYQ